MSFTTVSATKTLRVGIIGCGWFGRVHVERMSTLPNIQIAALSDPEEGAMQTLAAKVPDHARDPQSGVQTFTDYRAMIQNANLDIVSINSPNRWHVEQLLFALEQGKHVLCEKPLSMDPAEVKAAVAATQASGRLVAISYQSRYRQAARILRHELESGRWGRITSISIFSCEDWLRPNVGTWRHDPARCPGGFFADANGHQNDVMFWTTQTEAFQVRATTETRGTPVPMVTWGEARLRPQGSSLTAPDEGIPFTFTFVGDAHHWEESIRVMTERADFQIRNGVLQFSDGSERFGPFPEDRVPAEVASLPDIPDNGFIAALRGGPPVASPPETVWPVLNFTRAALASAENHGAIQTIA